MLLFYTMIANKTPSLTVNTSDVSATIVLTITAPARWKILAPETVKVIVSTCKREAATALDIAKLRALQPPAGLGFKVRRFGHVVLQVTDLERSLLFYTQVLGFKVTEIYSEDLQPGGFAFLRCHTDHHSIALVGAGAGRSRHGELHHIAFEVGSLAEVFNVRERLREQSATITFERSFSTWNNERTGAPSA
jgi:catechol 2,3-dioxygenase-like lactoylglutathione lyase family enzyme